MGDQGNRISRRSVLAALAAGGGLLAGGSTVEKMLGMMVHGLIRKAEADEAGILPSRNYVNLMLPGAPLRYGFDHWLRTQASEPAMISNPMVATRLVNVNGRAAGTEYATITYNNVIVPWIFGQQVYRGDGSKRPVSDLLSNMLVIRGYGSGLDGHTFNSAIQMAPLGGVSSISGLAADYSTRTFEAVQSPARGGDVGRYFSTKGKATNMLSAYTPLTTLMEGFSNPAYGQEARKLADRNRAAMDKARAYLQAYGRSDRPGASVVAKNMDNAVSMIKKGVSGVNDYWNPALGRYQAIIQNTMRDLTVPGITDMSLQSDGSMNFQIQASTELVATNNLRDSIANWSRPPWLAEGFALTEYVLTQGLATVSEIMSAYMGDIIIDHAAAQKQLIYMTHDMHATGSILATAFTNAYFRAIAACILELGDRLKATTVEGRNVWDDTIVQISADFARSARANGSGSDHGFNQMVTSVYGGVITGGPYVVGNVSVGGLPYGSSSYYGTQGMAAAIDGYNQNGPPTPAMQASTVAALLRVPANPFANTAAPLVIVDGGRFRVLKNGRLV